MAREVITRGFGAFGTIARVLLRGYFSSSAGIHKTLTTQPRPLTLNIDSRPLELSASVRPLTLNAPEE